MASSTRKKSTINVAAGGSRKSSILTKTKSPIKFIKHDDRVPYDLGRNEKKRVTKGTKIKKSAHLDLSHSQRKKGAYHP